MQEFNKKFAGEDRTYRVVEMYMDSRVGGKFQDVLNVICRAVENSDNWKHCLCTEQAVTDLHRLSLRAAAVMLELVIKPSLSFPYKLIATLDSPELINSVLEVHQQSPCMLDTFSKSFLDRYSAESALKSEEALVILHAVAQLVVGNTFDVERVHSKHATRSRHRVTHEMSLPDLALWHQAVAKPPWINEAAQAMHLRTGAGRNEMIQDTLALPSTKSKKGRPGRQTFVAVVVV